MRTIFPTVAALLLMTAMPAFAADKPLLPPPEKKTSAGPHDWTGFYAGADTGYVHGASKWSNDTPGGSSRSFGTSSPTFGAHAGYNYQLGSGVVFGSESDISHTH